MRKSCSLCEPANGSLKLALEPTELENYAMEHHKWINIDITIHMKIKL